MTDDNIRLRLATEEDGKNIVKFLFDHFYEDAPLSSCEPKSEPTKEDELHLLDCLKYDCSIVAVELKHDHETIVGVNIALPKKPSSVEEYFKTASLMGKSKMGQILKLLGMVNRDANIFERYSVDEILYLFISYVAPWKRGQHLAARMTLKLMELGKTRNYKVLSADCSSFYCARICESLGMECVNTVAYKDYVDENIKPYFIPAAPHIEMKTYVKCL